MRLSKVKFKSMPSLGYFIAQSKKTQQTVANSNSWSFPALLNTNTKTILIMKWVMHAKPCTVLCYGQWHISVLHDYTEAKKEHKDHSNMLLSINLVPVRLSFKRVGKKNKYYFKNKCIDLVFNKIDNTISVFNL